MKREYIHISLIINAVDMLLVFIVPSCLILSVNVAVVAHLALRRKLTSGPVTRKGTSSSSSRAAGTGRASTRAGMRRHIRERRKHHLLYVLFLIPTLCVLLNLPSYAIRMYSFIQVTSTRHSADGGLGQMEEVQVVSEGGGGLGPYGRELSKISLLIYYTNYAIDFPAIAIASKSFRFHPLTQIHPPVT